MRLFIAVSLPDEIKTQAEAILQAGADVARRERADVKWVRPEQLHFTLKFLGECPEEQLPEIEEALQTAVEGLAPFALKIEGLGCFPEQGTLRVLWLGAVEGGPAMQDLAGRVESACELLGFPKEERPFSAHLTLGRARSSKNMGKLRTFIEQHETGVVGTLTVRSIELIRSVLSPKGPTYTVLKSFEFR